MTELIWEGKYDKEGRKTAPVRVSLPFQTVETVTPLYSPVAADDPAIPGFRSH
jgi:hypothetical protein